MRILISRINNYQITDDKEEHKNREEYKVRKEERATEGEERSRMGGEISGTGLVLRTCRMNGWTADSREGQNDKETQTPKPGKWQFQEENDHQEECYWEIKQAEGWKSNTCMLDNEAIRNNSDQKTFSEIMNRNQM